jgi:hypothetical protein
VEDGVACELLDFVIVGLAGAYTWAGACMGRRFGLRWVLER